MYSEYHNQSVAVKCAGGWGENIMLRNFAKGENNRLRMFTRNNR
jgi:hypothetical protein